jgi:glycosyltransferase involved in cell wall biosynthesis
LNVRVFVPRLMDAANRNAQNSNARAILERWSVPDAQVRTLAYDEPDPAVVSNPRVRVARLWRRRAWIAHLAAAYLQPCDAIFYPGASAADLAGLRMRRRLGRAVPIIAVLEGLVGDAQREKEYSRLAGHPVYCQRIDSKDLGRVDALYGEASHIVAISPFLARMGTLRYGDKFSVLPLGVDQAVFHCYGKTRPDRFAVVGAGRLYENKRPDVFLELAARFPQADFTWYGEGELRPELLAEKSRRGLANVDYPGALSSGDLAERLRRASLFVLPSSAEGAPKVAQEAASCGLGVVLFGFYETPTVVDGRNGYVVRNDDELVERVGALIGEPADAEALGHASAQMAEAWSWEDIAPRWAAKVVEVARHDHDRLSPRKASQSR